MKHIIYILLSGWVLIAVQPPFKGDAIPTAVAYDHLYTSFSECQRAAQKQIAADQVTEIRPTHSPRTTQEFFDDLRPDVLGWACQERH